MTVVRSRLSAGSSMRASNSDERAEANSTAAQPRENRFEETPSLCSRGPSRRLMFVIEALTVGGAEHMVVDLANELAGRGDIVHVVCLTQLGELSATLIPSVTLHVLNKRPGVDYALPRRIRTLVREHAIQVVNSHLWTANLWTRLALAGSGVPVVVTEHNRDEWKRLHNRFIDRLLSRATARMIAVSNDTASYYRHDVGISRCPIIVVNNGVDAARYASGDGAKIRSTLALDDEFLIGTVGRLACAKNHTRLVEAAALLRDAGVAIKVFIAGEGPERAVTEARIAELGVENCVTLLGERSDVPDLLAAFDVFVLSSDREGHPLSALEAQCAGTPVVLTNAGGSADAVSENEQGCGGLLVEKNAQALARCLQELAAQPQKLTDMSVFARAYAACHYDKAHMINKYSVIFDDVRRV